MTDINLGSGMNCPGCSDAWAAGLGGFIGSWIGNGGLGWGGWGRGYGYGFGPGAGTGAVMAQNGFDTSMLHDDNMAIQNQLENIGARQTDANYRVNMNLSNGISSAYTALNNTLNQNNISNIQGLNDVKSAATSGTAQVQNTLAQGFAGINTAVTSQGYESRLATNALAQQMAECCCGIKSAVLEDGAKTRELLQQNYIAELQGQLCDAKSKASALETQNYLTASQSAQTAYLISQLKTA